MQQLGLHFLLSLIIVVTLCHEAENGIFLPELWL